MRYLSEKLLLLRLAMTEKAWYSWEMPLTDRQFWTRAWLCFFAYAVCASLFIQLVLLPYVVPAWHAGHGLMKDHDWVTYHAWGTELSRFLKMGDWKSWWNAEANWIEVRFISIPYAFIAPEPWALIPFNAFFHATTALLMGLSFVGIVTGKRKAALLGVLPYVFFPTALLWTSQIHKDGANNFAFSCFLFGWVQIFRTEDLKPYRLISALFFIGFGMYFSWIIRPYFGIVLVVCSGILLFAGIFAYVLSIFKGKNEKYFAFSLICSFVLVALLFPKVKNNSYASNELVRHTLTEVVSSEEEVQTEVPDKAIASESSPSTSVVSNTTIVSVPESVATSTAIASAPVQQIIPPKPPPTKKVKVFKPKTSLVYMDKNQHKAWEKTANVPDFIEEKAYRVATIRTGFIGMNLGKKNIDDHVYFSKILDEVFYLPRAVQLAALAPFPNAWFSTNSAEHNNVLKKIAIVEMLFVYVSLIFFCFFFAKHYKQKNVWVLFLFSLAVLTLFGMTVANLGTLCRFRYFFLLTWVGVGTSYAATLLPQWKRIGFPSFNRLKTKTA